MLLRDRSEGPPYHTRELELFEAAYFMLERTFPFLGEAYDALEWTMQRDPRGNSELCRAFRDQDREFRVALTSRTPRYPSLRVLIEIDEDVRRVSLWHLSVRATSPR